MGVRVLYVSPLKAMNNDIERNLAVPLAGVRSHDPDLPEIRVAVRTGDTPAKARQRMVRKPPHILITKPESLYLVLTADRSAAMLQSVRTVIVDEIHTILDSKRGSHLTLSLERLERIAKAPLQRVGLSATVRPVEVAARFLGGQDPARQHEQRPVRFIDASYRKAMDLKVCAVVDSYADLPAGSVWPVIVPAVAQMVDAHRSTLIFCNSRRTAERTADRLNEHRLREAGVDADTPTPGVRGSGSMFGIGARADRLAAAGIPPIRAHHGSVSRAARLVMEAELQAGRLPALVATASLELGIDIGEVDAVVQLQSPRSVASGLQRVGRSGHLVGQTSWGRIFPTHAEDFVEAVVIARDMLSGDIEATTVPESALDVLAQQIVAMAAVETWDLDDLYSVVRGAYPYRSLPRSAFDAVIAMLAGRYPTTLSRHLKPRIDLDRGAHRIAALPSSRLLATRTGGTIPDRGLFAMVTADSRKRIGELDEEFVFETRRGDTFVLGAQVWRVKEITESQVRVEPAPGELPRMPFWRAKAPARGFELGKRIGAFRRDLAGLLAALDDRDLQRIALLADEGPTGERDADEPSPALREVVALLRDRCAFDARSVRALVESARTELLRDTFAHDRRIVVESYEDGLVEPRMVVHSPFGSGVNRAWALAIGDALKEQYGLDAQTNVGDDGFLLRFGGAESPPGAEVVARLTSAEARERLPRALPASELFGARFRENAARALVLPRTSGGRRTPLWLSRLRAKDLQQATGALADFPITIETYRDCRADILDLGALTKVLDAIASGEITVVGRVSEAPSGVAAGLDYRFAMQYMYEYNAPAANVSSRRSTSIGRCSANCCAMAVLPVSLSQRRSRTWSPVSSVARPTTGSSNRPTSSRRSTNSAT